MQPSLTYCLTVTGPDLSRNPVPALLSHTELEPLKFFLAKALIFHCDPGPAQELQHILLQG